MFERFFVLRIPETGRARPHVVLESIGFTRTRSLLAGDPRAEWDGHAFDILTLEELVATRAGRRALFAWRAGDDSAFEHDLRAALGGEE
jgi:hypothetical protein